MTKIFKVKIGLPPELMSDTVEFIKKPYSLQINSQFRQEDLNYNRRATSGERGDISPCLFLKIEKKCLDFAKIVS